MSEYLWEFEVKDDGSGVPFETFFVHKGLAHRVGTSGGDENQLTFPTSFPGYSVKRQCVTTRDGQSVIDRGRSVLVALKYSGFAILSCGEGCLKELATRAGLLRGKPNLTRHNVSLTSRQGGALT